MTRQGKCPICGKAIILTHQLQTIEAQTVYHLREQHGMTKRQARVALNEAREETKEVENNGKVDNGGH